jgi:hypothetical protein
MGRSSSLSLRLLDPVQQTAAILARTVERRNRFAKVNMKKDRDTTLLLWALFLSLIVMAYLLALGYS